MPRIGLPAKAKHTKAVAGGASASPVQMLAVASGALAFRLVSALAAAFAAWVIPRAHAPAGAVSTDFGLAPLLTQEVDRWLGRWLASPVTPTLIVSWVAFAAAMVMLLRLAQLDVDGDRAEGAVLLASAFPFAFVLGRNAADALFLLFVLGAFDGFRRQQWVIGGLSGALATATLPTAILMLPALAWTGVRQPGARRARIAAALVVVAAGFGTELAYMYYRAGRRAAGRTRCAAGAFTPARFRGACCSNSRRRTRRPPMRWSASSRSSRSRAFRSCGGASTAATQSTCSRCCSCRSPRGAATTSGAPARFCSHCSSSSPPSAGGRSSS